MHGRLFNAPMAAINDRYYEDLTAESFGALLDEFAAGRTPAPGSAIGRQGATPEGGALVLTDPKLYDGSAAKPLKSLPNAPPKPKAKAAKEPAA